MSASARLVLDLGKPILLTFDAFGTLFKPQGKIATLYARSARKHGLTGFTDEEVGRRFRQGRRMASLAARKRLLAFMFHLLTSYGSSAYKDEHIKHPNYGKKDGMDSTIWWGNVCM